MSRVVGAIHPNQISAWNRTADTAGVSTAFNQCFYKREEKGKEEDTAKLYEEIVKLKVAA